MNAQWLFTNLEGLTKCMTVNYGLQEVLVFESHERLSDESTHTKVEGSVQVVLSAQIYLSLVDTKHGILVLSMNNSRHAQPLYSLHSLLHTIQWVQIALLNL